MSFPSSAEPFFQVSPNHSAFGRDSLPQMRNDEFLALIRRDRREAGTWLVSALGNRVWGLARRRLGADAEDGVQEAFREMFRSLDRFRGEAAVTTWGYRVAMNTLIDFARKRGRIPPALPLEAADESPRLSGAALGGFAENPFTLLDREERRARVRAALASLDEIHRTVLELRSYEGLGYAEIAEVLGVPLGTVKSRMAAASVKLAEKLQSAREEA